ncbi:hypothetical protein F5884DRAFT_852884 [Xylogone sp. PMI_703]|nr:hypothetical protein F5884DRAFT_852884 [Xylogone sp. PMI_703]
MSPPPKSQKKVHYEPETFGHKSHSSRDSGIGTSSSASRSDRASSGTSAAERFAYQEIEDQRFNMRALQEALDAANDKIASLQLKIASLNEELGESNKDRRSLKKQNSYLIDQLDRLEKQHDKKSSSSSSFSTSSSGDKKATSDSKLRRNSTTSRAHSTSPRSRYPPLDTSSSILDSSHSGSYTTTSTPRDAYRRPTGLQSSTSSWQAPYSPPPAAPQPPPNPTSSMYPPGVSYSMRSQPVYASSITRSDIVYPNDGLYHPRPL